MSRRLQLTYEWHLAAPPSLVWGLLTRIEDWPQWWSAVSEVKSMRSGNYRGEGAMLSSVWKGCFTHKVGVMMRTIVAEENIMLVTKSHGDLQGLARWELSDIPVGTTVRYTGEVSISSWLRWLYPAVSPLIDRHYHKIMREGATGMAKRLGVELIDYNKINLTEETHAPARN